MAMPRFMIPSLVCLASSMVALCSAGSVMAADRVIVKYGPLQESVAVADLATFAETGQASGDVEAYLRMTNSNPAQIRTILTQQMALSPILLDRGLNNPLGNLILDEAGQVIRPPAKVANREALRSTLVLSASDDGKVSLLEALQKYPTREVLVEGDRLAEAYDRMNQAQEQIQRAQGTVETVLELLKRI